MDLPDDLHYSKLHTWLRVEGKTGTIGITHFAQDQLGEIVYVDLPKIGFVFHQDEVFGSIEALKTTSDLFIPVGGTVVQVNEKLKAYPTLINSDPYEEGWLIKMSIADMNDIGHLLVPKIYNQLIL
ncbi:MAG: glycine cleavage system protein GcvH [Bacteroidota bacterium]